MSALTDSLLQQMDMVILRHLGDAEYAIVNEFNPWFAALWPNAYTSRTLKLREVSPFLDHFLHDATRHWLDAPDAPPLKSGPFLEITPEGETLPLEATAAVSGKERLLVLANLGETYQDTLKLMQAARDNLLTQEKLEVEVSKRTAEIRDREAEIAGRLIHAAGFRDEETGAHIRRIGLYSSEIAAEMGQDPFEIDDIRTAAPMHDIGKIGTPDNILKKPGRLSVEEFQVMKLHTTIGVQILGGSNIPMLFMAAEIAGAHHENFDGTGYPHGLRGEHIPWSARVVAVVDVYDALVHKRVYKDAFPEEEALKIMSSLNGTKFDPDIYELFIRNLDTMREIRRSIADDG